MMPWPQVSTWWIFRLAKPDTPNVSWWSRSPASRSPAESEQVARLRRGFAFAGQVLGSDPRALRLELLRHERGELLIVHFVRGALAGHGVLVLRRVSEEADELLLDLTSAGDVYLLNVEHVGGDLLEELVRERDLLMVGGVLVGIVVRSVVGHMAQNNKGLIRLRPLSAYDGGVSSIHPNAELFLGAS